MRHSAHRVINIPATEYMFWAGYAAWARSALPRTSAGGRESCESTEDAALPPRVCHRRDTSRLVDHHRAWRRHPMGIARHVLWVRSCGGRRAMAYGFDLGLGQRVAASSTALTTSTRT